MPTDIVGTHPTGHETELQRLFSEIAPPGKRPGPSYYDIPMLKKPVWTWEIGVYFFLGGVSAGSYLLARAAERAGGRRYRALTRAGTAVALVALAPCPALLIADLGDPKRFHHMLRVFKPRSPMSLGSWVLTAYSGVLFLTAVREWQQRNRHEPIEGAIGKTMMLILDAAGVPLAFLFSGYTGVLLSGAATPVWTKNPWLGPLFSAGAIANGAAATNLLLHARTDPDGSAGPAKKALETIESAAQAAEAITLAGYLGTAGELAHPFTHGPVAPLFWGAVAGSVAGAVLRHLPVSRSARTWFQAAAAVAGLASGLCLKYGMKQAGVPSASDPNANRAASRPRRIEAGSH